MCNRNGWFRWFAAGAIALAAIAAASAESHAAGLLIADGGFGGSLEIQQHDVRVTINNGIAVTEIDQVFRNLEKRTVEALYTFPVPDGASVSNFSMWIDGREMVGEVVEKQRARQIYESYKPARRDPGLLEQTDFKTFEMRIFPIGPEAQQRVRIVYYQELDIDNDWATYVYPLATVTRKDLTARTAGRFTMRIQVKSEVPIAAVESPSHADELAVARHADTAFEASLEAQGADLDRDVVLAYQLSRLRTGVDLIASKEAGQDGYFCLPLTTGQDLAEQKRPMDYVFILDSSGSMGVDGKFALSRETVGSFLAALAPEDRLEVITFSAMPQMLFQNLVPADETARTAVAEALGRQATRGGTALGPALQVAYKYKDPQRFLNVIVLSDGITEDAERSTLADLIRSRPAETRVFCIGVGNEVNRPLLEQLAVESGGLAAFLSSGDNLDRQAKAFWRKLMHPVGSNLRIALEGVSVYDLEPPQLPNLYHGYPVRLYGRYKGSGQATVIVKADVDGQEITSEAQVELPAADDANPEIERMWAWHRVQRLIGEGATDTAQIVRLGEGYSIVTPYTSFLVLENDAEYKRWQIERRNVLRAARDAKAQQAVQAMFESIRARAASEIGPEAAAAAKSAVSSPADGRGPMLADAGRSGSPADVSPGAAPAPSTPSRPNDLRWPRGRGGGPVGLLGVAIAGILALRERRCRRRMGSHA